jgi:hypothetical protein
MTYCPHNQAKAYELEWIDRRLPFLRSLKSDLFCQACADDLESDEFVEIVAIRELRIAK